MQNYSTELASSLQHQANLLAETIYEQYGGTTLKTSYCPVCKKRAFLIDGQLQCCGLNVGDIPATDIRVASIAMHRRKRPNIENQVLILEEQNNQSIYCGVEFGSITTYRGRNTVVKVHWDHYIPYSYCGTNNTSNFVASCPICNGIKHSLIFNTLDEAKSYIVKRKKELDTRCKR